MTEAVRLITREVQIHDSVVTSLKEALADTEAGELCACLIIGRMKNGDWKRYRSGTISHPEIIGLVELAKIEWATDYLNDG